MRYYFVDEAGDGNLFDAKGQAIIGTEGCSRYFITNHTKKKPLNAAALKYLPGI